jgi:hypothetical protein
VAIWEHDYISTAPPWNSKITAAAALRTNTPQDRLSVSSQQALIPGCGPSIDDVQGTHQHPLGGTDDSENEATDEAWQGEHPAMTTPARTPSPKEESDHARAPEITESIVMMNRTGFDAASFFVKDSDYAHAIPPGSA